MSIARKIKLDLDLSLAEDVARNMGFNISHNSPVALYGRASQDNMSLVIKNPSDKWSIGFSKEGEAVFDSDIQKTYNNFLTSYRETAVLKKARGYSVVTRTDETDRLILVLRRG